MQILIHPDLLLSGHYRPERRRNSASGYSFGMRTKTFTHDSTPSPSAYTIPSYVGSGGNSFYLSFPHVDLDVKFRLHIVD